MLSKGKGGRFVGFKIVAAVAGIEIRCRGKLPRMAVAMTISTAAKRDVEQSVLAPGDVTFSAL